MAKESTRDVEHIKDDIVFDIYMYEQELTAPNLKTSDKEDIQEKIIAAEELFKTIE